ncbi:RNase P/RNase MRP complex subunit [Dinochytrium kinnereticum]|nr:RNase P/RNase MRP complex subunit [Dinochytrium kinnereticum]
MYAPLHQLWMSYMTELLGPAASKDSKDITLPKIAKADLHGAIMTVTRSRCPDYVNISGIMIKETENTFTFITPRNKLRQVPKAHNVFCFSVGGEGDEGLTFTLFGDHFKGRAADRVSKKFKAKSTIDL